MEPFTTLTSRFVPLPYVDIDTDQIIPAVFLKVTTREGLAEGLFTRWRYDPGGQPDPAFPLNRPERAGAQILVAGHNFGCGSSREHAPWALIGWGFRAVVSSSFADIFASNALKNGLLPVTVEPAILAELLAIGLADPAAELTIDLAAQRLILPAGRALTFPIDPFSKLCLLQGVDQLGYLLQHEPAIAAFEAGRPDFGP
jgi:3-isopropylmalate/(R)-2-methylmalate dehydratase small subunit